MEKVLVIIGISNIENSHYAANDLHKIIINKQKIHNNILHFSFINRKNLDIIANIREQCDQIKCNFNHNKVYIIGISCNTMILYLDYYKQCMNFNNVVLLNPVILTCEYLNKKGFNNVGILATTTSIKMNLFGNYLDNYGIDHMTINEHDQNKLDKIIRSKITKNNRSELCKMVKYLIKNGCQVIILGCTELPLILKEKVIDGIQIINTMDILARNMLKY
tara:strand:+ start:1424 stop:2083 length:660 start_codon:yes stop_codon:yes gene_type:complete